MANLFSDGNAVAAEIFIQEFGLRLADRSFIGAHPALEAGFLGVAQGAGVITKTFDSAGEGVLAAVAEGSDATAVNYAYTELQATVARRASGRSVSSMLASISPGGQINDPVRLSYDAITQYNNTLMALIAAAGVTATANVGVSGTDCSWAVIDDAVSVLETAHNPVEAGLCMVLHPEQWKNLRAQSGSGTGLSDAASWEKIDKMQAKSMGFKGNYRGVDLYVSPRLTTANAGADVQGFAFARYGIVHSYAPVKPNPRSWEMILGEGRLQMAFDPDPKKALENIWFNAFLGVGLGFDAAVVKITTDAP
jgi:hypothetical protein